MEANKKMIENFLTFLKTSPTPWHACEQIGSELKGFTRLEEADTWKLQPGKAYFIQRGGSLCAFRMPTEKGSRILILASHTDSPALKVKPKPEKKVDGMVCLDTEVYGGPLYYSWLDRALAIAGRIFIEEEGSIKEKLVYLDKHPLFIPSLAIHQNREVNEKGLILNAQEHLSALATLDNSSFSLDKLLGKTLDSDLFLVPTESPELIGQNGEMVAAYRIDNLASAYCALLAIKEAPARKETIQVAFFANHEEIGSASSEGADSSMLAELLERLFETKEAFFRAKSLSLCLSMDMSHAHHPNYPGKSEPNEHVLLGKGVAIKYNAKLRYATSGAGAAKLKQLAEKEKMSLQAYVARSDMACGSTVGPMCAARLGIETVDVGMPQLGMHSARELMATADLASMSRLATVVLEKG